MKREKNNPFSMSFLDVMACGFGALVLILLLSNFNEADTQSGTDSFSFLDALSEIVSIQDSSSEEISKNTSLEKIYQVLRKNFQNLRKNFKKQILKWRFWMTHLLKIKKNPLE